MGEINDSFLIKLKSVLDKILVPTFKSSDDSCLHKLNDYLSLQNSGLECVLLPWLGEAERNWASLSKDTKVFTLHLVGSVCRTANGFHAVANSGVLEKLSNCAVSGFAEKDHSLTGAGVDLLCCLSGHSPGLKFIWDAGHWCILVALYYSNNSIYTKEKLRRLLTSLLTELTDESFELKVSEAFPEFLAPLDIPFGETDSPVPVTTFQMKAMNRVKLIRAAELGSELVLAMLSKPIPQTRMLEVVHGPRLHLWAWNELHSSHDEAILRSVSRFLATYNLLKLDHVSSGVVSIQSCSGIYNCMLSHFTLMISRHLFTVMNDTVVHYHKLWNKYGSELSLDGPPPDAAYCTITSLSIQNFLFACQAFPMFFLLKNSNQIQENEVVEAFIDKLFEITCVPTVRLAYVYRGELRKSRMSPDTIGPLAIEGFIHLSDVLRKEQAVLVFQTLSHVLKEFLFTTLLSASHPEYVLQGDGHIQYNIDRYPNLLSSLIHGFTCYLTKFNLTWSDSMETLCTLSFFQKLLTHPSTPTPLYTRILKVVKLVLLKYMPPNLALLVDTLQGSSMEDLGKQLYKTLHSPTWEIRDSTLEVVEAISSLADTKFPAFQSLLLDNKFPEVILDLIKSDHESYVRASALSCLRELVKIQTVWDSVLHKSGIIDNLLHILHFESEGIVRCQAALAVAEIYKHRTISEQTMERMYNTMYHVAQNDLHWEVKVNALQFWAVTVEKSLTKQGMTDGSFPQFLFSKEKKKIVTLSPTDKSLRVYKALVELSKIGCLQVLWETVNRDECDLEVQKKSLELTEKIIRLIDDFDLTATSFETELDSEPLCSTISPKPIVRDEVFNSGPTLHITSLLPVTADEVIDQIAVEGDIQLVPQLIVTSNPPLIAPCVNRISFPAPEFIRRIKSSNLGQTIGLRSDWVLETAEGIHSLLDDILLFSKDINDTNATDCY